MSAELKSAEGGVGSQPSAESIFEAAKECESLQDTISMLDWALDVDPDFANAHFAKGWSIKQLADKKKEGPAKMGQYEEAEASYRKVIELEPKNGEAYFCLGDVLLKLGQGRLDEAVDSYRSAALQHDKILAEKIEPKLSAISEEYARLGSIEMQGGKFQNAYEYFVKAANTDSTNYKASKLLSGIKTHFGDHITLVADDPTEVSIEAGVAAEDPVDALADEMAASALDGGGPYASALDSAGAGGATFEVVE